MSRIRVLLVSAVVLLAACGVSESTVATEVGADGSDSQALSSFMTVSPSSISGAQGGTATFSVTLATSTSTRHWVLAATGLPAGVVADFSPTTVKQGETAQATLHLDPGAAVGSASFKVRASSGLVAHVAPATLVVSAGSGAGGGGGGGAGGAGGSPTPGPTGPVGPGGGTVPLLHFVVTGDTRPPACEDTAHYPTPIIGAIADAATHHQAQFGLDLGDHMYVCNGDVNLANQQMDLYMQAVRRFAGTWFMTMGNHECYHGPCLLGSTNANYVAFMKALAPIAPKPYYSFSVETSRGRATFVIIADNGWDSAQATWLEQTLADADLHATYTIVARHHPEGDTSVPTNADSMAIIRRHKFALLLTGHAHTYQHQTTDQGRDLVMGLGGAPLLAAGATFNGYALIDQLSDGRLQVSVRDVAGDSPQDTWSVGPNP